MKISTQTKNKTVLIFSLAVFTSGMFTIPFASNNIADAASIDELRARTQQLEQAIDASNAKANQLRGQGNSLKSAIASIDIKIDVAQNRIELTKDKIEVLKDDLQKTRDELDRQKQLLRANVLALYKRGDASEVEMIAGSENFSSYIDEQEYLERIKAGIQDSAEKVAELEKKIQAQEEEQEHLLAEQKAAKKSLDDSRAERADLLSETQGRESNYRAHSQRLLAEQEKILSEIVARSQVVVSGGVGTGSYPWAHYREGSWTHWGSCYYGDDIDPWGYCYRQCVSYVAWKLYATGHNPPRNLGNASSWPVMGRTPRVGAVAIWNGFNEGHVAFVEAVYGNGTVRISEYNAVPAYQGRYSERIISAGDPSGYAYY